MAKGKLLEKENKNTEHLPREVSKGNRPESVETFP